MLTDTEIQTAREDLWVDHELADGEHRGQVDAEILAIVTLEEFAFDPRVGAHTATGCGLIGGQYNVSVRRTRRGDIEDIGSVSWDDIHGLKVEGDEINSWIDIWEKLEINPENIKA